MSEKELNRKQKQLDKFYKILNGALTPIEMQVVRDVVELELEIEAECSK